MTQNLPESLLVFSIGASAYLALVRLWLGFPARGPSAWAGIWALLAVLFASARLAQLHAITADTAIAMARLYGACTPLMIASLVLFTRTLTAPRAPYAGLTIASALALAALMLLTPWFVSDRVIASSALNGRPYLGVDAGPWMPVVGGVIGVALAACLSMIWRSAMLPRFDKGLLGVSLAVYAAMGATTLASSVAWVASAGIGEYGPLLVAISTSCLLARRQAALEDDLERRFASHTQAREVSEARFRHVIEHAPIGFLVTNASGELDHANRALLAMLGSTREQFEGAFNVADDASAKRSGFSAMFARALASGEALSDEFEFDTWWGRRLHTRTTVSPYRDAAGTVIGALAIVEDITEQRAIENRLRRTQRLEAVGQLAAGIAHEINNPMAYVRSNLGVLAEELGALEKKLAESGTPSRPELSAQVRFLEGRRTEALASVERTVAIVRDLREFARASGGPGERVDVNALLEHAARLASTRVDGLSEVALELGDISPVAIDASQLRQVLFNLITQAQQAAGPSGHVRATTTRADGCVLICVHDDGPAIRPEERGRLFEPFAVARGAGEPTLGLYVSRQIVNENDGKLEVLSSETHGTTFAVRLPVAHDESSRSADPAARG
jgi:PAS domain S-box-containing protein